MSYAVGFVRVPFFLPILNKLRKKKKELADFNDITTFIAVFNLGFYSALLLKT